MHSPGCRLRAVGAFTSCKAVGSRGVSSPPRGREPNAGGGQLVGQVATGSSWTRGTSAGSTRCWPSAGPPGARGISFARPRLDE
eukprot:2077146-Alexandrium_andersonii.AAC.1